MHDACMYVALACSVYSYADLGSKVHMVETPDRLTSYVVPYDEFATVGRSDVPGRQILGDVHDTSFRCEYCISIGSQACNANVYLC
eukprot:COSAG05_NODE_4432_length_1519_cov_1.550000_2_plen_86_part_00